MSRQLKYQGRFELTTFRTPFYYFSHHSYLGIFKFDSTVCQFINFNNQYNLQINQPQEKQKM